MSDVVLDKGLGWRMQPDDTGDSRPKNQPMWLFCDLEKRLAEEKTFIGVLQKLESMLTLETNLSWGHEEGPLILFTRSILHENGIHDEVVMKFRLDGPIDLREESWGYTSKRNHDGSEDIE